MPRSHRMTALKRTEIPTSPVNPTFGSKESSSRWSIFVWIGLVPVMVAVALGVGWLLSNLHLPKPSPTYVDNCHLALPASGYPVEGGVDPGSGSDAFVVYDSPNVDTANSFVAVVSDAELQAKMRFRVEVINGTHRKQPHKVELDGTTIPWGSQCALKVKSVAPVGS